MGENIIPLRLTVVELCIAALMEAAEVIEAAHDAAAFLTALDGNHRLWLAVGEAVGTNGWTEPSRRDIEFAIDRSSTLGRGVKDADVEAMVAINRRMAEQLAVRIDVVRIRTRARLAYREGGGGGFFTWLLGQMNRKARIRSMVATAAEGGGLRCVIGGQTPV